MPELRSVQFEPGLCNPRVDSHAPGESFRNQVPGISGILEHFERTLQEKSLLRVGVPRLAR